MSSRIENYLGFPSGLSGGDLARRAVVQARGLALRSFPPKLLPYVSMVHIVY
jgi:thioredoxin reductase (NADPH)